MKLLLLPVLLCSISLLCAESPVWEPERTWVFAVGVIKFDDPTTTSWPEKGRVDAEMIRVLEKRGVPADHILFLKNEQATKDNIVRKFNPFLKRAGPADTLILCRPWFTRLYESEAPLHLPNLRHWSEVDGLLDF